MKNKQIITLIGTTVAGVSVFGLAVGLATTVRYNSEDPKKAVTTFASSVANVSFNTQAFPIDASYESIKKQLFSKGGPEADKGVNFNKILTFYELAKTDGEQATNDAREFVAINSGTSLDPHFVVDSFTFDDKSKTFKVDYHVEQILKNNHKVISKNYTKTIAIAQRINFFLADVVDDAKASFGKLVANTLADLQAATDKTLVKIPEISRAVDFQNDVNQAANSQQAIASINAYFKNFSTILTNFTNSKKNALPDNAPIYSFALVRNALTGNYVDVNSQGIATFYLQTSLSPIAKRDLTNIENKNLTYVDAISIAKVTDSQVASYFTSAQDILGNIDLTFNKAARRTTLAAQSSARAAGTTTTVNTTPTTQTKEISQTTAFDFLSELQKGLPFASTLQARQDYIKQLVNSYTKNGLSFAFNGDLTNFYNAGAFGEASQESQTGLSYTFLDKDIAVVPTSSGDFAVSLPVKIELKNSFFGGSDETVVASKEVTFELTGFKSNASISQDQQNLAFKPVASSTATAKKIEPIVLPEQNKRLVYNLDPSPYSRFVYNFNPYLSQEIKDGISSGQQAASASQAGKPGSSSQQGKPGSTSQQASPGTTSAATTTPTTADTDDEKDLSEKEKQLAQTLLANAWGHFTKSSAPVSLEEIKALVSGNKNDELYKLFSNRAGYSYDFGTTNAYVDAWTGKTKFPTLEQISKFAKDETDFASESHIGSLDTTDFFAKPADVAAFYGYLAEQGPATVASYLLQLAQSWGVVDKDVNVAQKIKEFQANPGSVFAKAFAIKGKDASQANTSKSSQPQQQPETKILSFNKQYLDLHNQGFYSSLVLPKKAEEIVKKAFGLESGSTDINVTKSDSDILQALQNSKDQLDLIDGNNFKENGTDFAQHAKDQKNIDRPDSSTTSHSQGTSSGPTTSQNYQGFKTFGDVLIAFYIKALQFNNFAPFSTIDSKLIAKPTFTNLDEKAGNDEITKDLFKDKMDDGKFVAIDYYYTFGYANDKGEIEKPLFVTPTKTIIFNVSNEETKSENAVKVSELDKAIVSIPIYYQNATVDNFNNQFFANSDTDTSASGTSQDSTKWIDDSTTHTLATVLGQQGKDLESYVATHYPNYKIMINPKVETDRFNSNKKVITLALQEITPASTESKPSVQASVVTGQKPTENASQTEDSTATQGSQTSESTKAKTITQTLPITKNQQSSDDEEGGSSAGTKDQQSSNAEAAKAKTAEAQPQPKPSAPQIPMSSLHYKIYVSAKSSQSTTE